MDDRITIDKVAVDTSYGITVFFDQNLDFSGIQHPAAWDQKSLSCAEFDKQEVIDEEVLIGRKEGAKAEAHEILAKEISSEDTELDGSDVKDLTRPWAEDLL